jgi:hypothetical protein
MKNVSLAKRENISLFDTFFDIRLVFRTLHLISPLRVVRLGEVILVDGGLLAFGKFPTDGSESERDSDLVGLLKSQGVLVHRSHGEGATKLKREEIMKWNSRK